MPRNPRVSHLAIGGLTAMAAMTFVVSLLAAPPAAAAEPTELSLSLSPKRIGVGEAVNIVARLDTETIGTSVAGQPVVLQWQRGGTTGWRDLGSAVTAADGRADWEQTTRYSGQFRAVFAGSPDLDPTMSEATEVHIKPTIRTELKRKWVRTSGSVRLAGTASPAFKGERMHLQRRFQGGWRTIARDAIGGRGGFAFRVPGTSVRGPSRYRAHLPERARHLGASSAVRKVTTVRVVTYHIETRGRIVVSMKEFRERAQEIYDDPRGWSRAYVRFKRVRSGGAFSLVLSEARYVPTFAPICDRYWSCRVGRYVIINQNRWRWGTPYFKRAGGNLSEYRAMVLNHETGHWFSLGHASCGGAGRPAPVMMQQSKGLYGCEPNPWPLRWEINQVR